MYFFFLDIPASFQSLNYCQPCKSLFTTRSKLNEHNLKNHAKPSVICEKCGKDFASEKDLSDHLATHTEVLLQVLENDTLVCYICGMAFDHQESYELHLLTHDSLTINLLENSF